MQPRSLLYLLFLFSIPNLGDSQISIIYGESYNWLKQHNETIKSEGIFAPQFGASVFYVPHKSLKKTTIEHQFLVNRRGYTLLSSSSYRFQFNYYSFLTSIHYKLTKRLQMGCGFELSYLASMNIDQGTVAFNRFDTGLLAQISFTPHKRIKLYTRGYWGLNHVLDYHTFDSLGNFTGEIHDFYLKSITLGIQYFIWYEEFKL